MKDGEPQGEERGAPEEAHAQRDEDSDLKNQIRTQIKDLDPIEGEKPLEKLRGGERKASFEERGEGNELTSLDDWLQLVVGHRPHYSTLRWEQPLIDEGAKLVAVHDGPTPGFLDGHPL
jgi:hypothetical protein